jgi:DNA repair ATPase RecN
MTPAGILTRALALGIRVVAITDHNTIDNVQEAVSAASGLEVLVVPGVELASPGGHILVYAKDVERLQQLLAKLSFDEQRTACRTSIPDILRATSEVAGFAIAAHVDLANGLENAIPGYGDPKAAVITDRALYAIEVANPEALAYYSDEDDDARKELLHRRLDVLADPFCRILPKVVFSDAHTFAAIGQNRQQRSALTRVKMGHLSWEALVAAFADPEARVRVEEYLPPKVPRFVGLHLDGGFLAGQTFGFSPNLTCIIGGRGSGKSTALQTLRVACGKTPSSGVHESDAWPTRADLHFIDEEGDSHQLVLRGTELTEAGAAEPVRIPVDSLEQGEMARTIEKCGRDPQALLDFLDELVDLSDLRAALATATQALDENSREISDLQDATAQLEPLKATLATEKRQQETAAKANTEQLIQFQRELARANELREALLPGFRQAAQRLTSAFEDCALDTFADLAESAKQLAKTTAENPFEEILSSLRTATKGGREAVERAIAEAEPKVAGFLTQCQARQRELQEGIDKEAERLRGQGIPLDMRFLTKLARDVQKHEQLVKELARKTSRLKEAKVRRKALLTGYRQTLGDCHTRRRALAEQLTRKLREFLVDWSITVTFAEGCLAADVESALKETMDWRTAAVPKAPALVASLGAPALIQCIENGDATGLAAARSKKGDTILTTGEATEVVTRFKQWEFRRRLEECKYSDLPRLVVSRPRVDADGHPTSQWLTREFGELSLGQQQSIVLAILLSIDRPRPLLIDQPEDNLDSAFIFQILVKALRRIKERRQVIVVTHNANIAVLADADLVIPLKATAESGVVVSPGTVDADATRELVCEILEGGRAAYERRGRLYGLRLAG